MFRLTCFADEISADLDEQVGFMKENNINYVELRGVWDKNILDLNNDELNVVKSKLYSNGIKVSSIGSPIGKTDITESFEMLLPRIQHAFEIAQMMETPYVRVFSFYTPKEGLDFYEQEVFARMKQMVRMAEKHGVILLHENEADIYGETSERCLKLFRKICRSNYKAVFDHSNFVVAGEDVFNESFLKLKDYIEYIHVKDSVRETGEIVVAGCGDGCIPEILDELRGRNGMFVSLEPHLLCVEKYRGFSTPELFLKDLKAFRRMMEEMEIELI